MMLISRRRFHRRVGLSLLGIAAGGAGCAWLPPAPAPLVPFGDFTLTKSGGIAGIFEELRVDADGTGLVLSDDPAAGRIDPSTMDRLRELLESERLRRDVARVRSNDRGPQCTDAFYTTLRMGELEATRIDTCSPVSTPAWSELDEIVKPYWNGTFDHSLGAEPAPPMLVVDTLSGGRPTGTRIRIDGDGTATLIVDGKPVRTASIEPEQLAAVRLLAIAPECASRQASEDGYLVRIDDRPPIPVRGTRIAPDCPDPTAIARIAVAAVGE